MIRPKPSCRSIKPPRSPRAIRWSSRSGGIREDPDQTESSARGMMLVSEKSLEKPSPWRRGDNQLADRRALRTVIADADRMDAAGDRPGPAPGPDQVVVEQELNGRTRRIGGDGEGAGRSHRESES